MRRLPSPGRSTLLRHTGLAILALASALASAVALAEPSSGPLAMPPPGASTQERLEQAGVPGEPLRLALRAFRCAQAAGQFETSILTLVDYSLPSSARRLWVLDLDAGQVRFHTLVAHGRRSGVHRATTFSNVPGSKQSSLGLFRTGEAYRGRHGYSLRLDGLEPGVNDLALERGIVVHGADYATADFAREQGRLGRSWGCLALDPSLNRSVIDTIRDGSAVFAYYPEPRWLASSEPLRCEAEPMGPETPPKAVERRQVTMRRPDH